MGTAYSKNTFENINAGKFFSKYLPHIKNIKHKMRGTNGNGKPIDFSDDEKKQIAKALKLLCKDLNSK